MSDSDPIRDIVSNNIEWYSPAAASGVRGGDKRVFVRPGRGAFAMTTIEIEVARLMISSNRREIDTDRNGPAARGIHQGRKRPATVGL